MLLSSLPAVLLSYLVLNGAPASALQGPLAPAKGPAPVVPAGKTGAAAPGAAGGDAPGDLLQYQKTNAKTLTSRCHDQREKALAMPTLPDEVVRYANGKLGGKWVAMGGMNEKGFKGTPFTGYSVKANIMYTGHGCHVIMNGKSPFVRSYKADKQSEAGQSFLHFLVIPIRRVYNGAVLPDKKWITSSKAAFRDFIREKSWHQKATTRVWHMISDKKKVDNFNPKKDRADWARMSKLAKGLKESDFAYAFHVGVDASVPHLHMHVVASPAKLRALSSGKHDEKDVPPETLWAEISSKPLAKYKGWTPEAISAANGGASNTRAAAKSKAAKAGRRPGGPGPGPGPSGHRKRSPMDQLYVRDLAAQRAAFRMTE